MDVEFVTRVVIVGAAALLAVTLLAFGPSSAPRPHRVRGVRGRSSRHLRFDATNLMSYVAATMAVTLGGVLAVTH